MKKLLTILCLVLLSSCSPPDGPYETFHDNGQLSFRGNIVDGEPNGLFEYFHDNGQLRLRGNNVDGETDGLSEYFDENGNLTGTETYRNGELVEENNNP